jgi:hypothetical protein
LRKKLKLTAFIKPDGIHIHSHRLGINSFFIQPEALKSLYRSPGYEKTNWSYVKTMSCSGSHLGIPINIKNMVFVKDLSMIDAQFRFNQCISFREENISVFSHMVLC